MKYISLDQIPTDVRIEPNTCGHCSSSSKPAYLPDTYYFGGRLHDSWKLECPKCGYQVTVPEDSLYPGGIGKERLVKNVLAFLWNNRDCTVGHKPVPKGVELAVTLALAAIVIAIVFEAIVKILEHR